jgi:hypothetical protein
LNWKFYFLEPNFFPTKGAFSLFSTAVGRYFWGISKSMVDPDGRSGRVILRYDWLREGCTNCIWWDIGDAGVSGTKFLHTPCGCCLVQVCTRLLWWSGGDDGGLVVGWPIFSSRSTPENCQPEDRPTYILTGGRCSMSNILWYLTMVVREMPRRVKILKLGISFEVFRWADWWSNFFLVLV